MARCSRAYGTPGEMSSCVAESSVEGWVPFWMLQCCGIETKMRMLFCLGHPRRTRFNAECKFNVACYDEASLAAMRNEWAWSHWIASGYKEYPQLHWAWTVPLFYLLGVLCAALKMALNPPCLSGLLSTLRFEVDAPFPGSDATERLAFAKRWYSMQPRQPPFDGWRVPSRFTHLPARGIWMERFSLFRWIVLPAQCSMARFDASLNQWHINSPWWGPHLLEGWIITGENPSDTGWLITGEFKCWIFLMPVYKWLIVRCLEAYGDSVAAALQVKQAPIYEGESDVLV